MHKLVRQKSRLTEKCASFLFVSRIEFSFLLSLAWDRIREIFQPALDAARQRLVEIELEKLHAGRRDIVEKVYAQYKLTLSPLLWKNLPSVYNICKLGPFVPLIEADAGVTVAAADFEACMGLLPQLIAEAFGRTKSRLHQSVMEANHPIHAGVQSSVNFQELELATMVFRCGSCRSYVLGFESGVTDHDCSPGVGLSSYLRDLPIHDDFPYRFDFSAEGASAVTFVLEAAGLNPKSATVSELAEQDCAFRCLECTYDHAHSVRSAFSWLGMVSDLSV